MDIVGADLVSARVCENHTLRRNRWISPSFSCAGGHKVRPYNVDFGETY